MENAPYALALALLVGCGSKVEDGTATNLTTSTTGTTGTTQITSTTQATGDITASCAVQSGNTLRFDCSFTLPTAEALTVEVSDDAGDVVRSFSSDASENHTVTLWGLAPTTTYTWNVVASAGTASGTATTGALPNAFSALNLATSGDVTAVDHYMIPLVCGGDSYMVIADGAGTVKWYESLGGAQNGPLGGMTGFRWTEEETVVVHVNAADVLEIDASGAVLLDTNGFSRPMHHDVDALGDYIYALNAESHAVSGGNVVVDGFYVIDRTTGATVAEWDLNDYVNATVSGGGGGPGGGFWGSEFPGADDWAHANAIHVYADGTALLSLRAQDAVVEVVADPNDPNFGDIHWILTGQDGNDLSSDFSWSGADSGFDGQHCANWNSAGDLLLFDNAGQGVNSRAMQFDVNTSTGVATVISTWDMGRHCDTQGAVYEISNGVLATCANDSYVAAFNTGSDSAVWTLDASCGAGGPLTRAMPLSL
ncbi:MAG: hypothetical protein GWP91_02460 [Rhodobacterales bacterium]|nr:hypothetical protein [Rhodobacterales bacterium]